MMLLQKAIRLMQKSISQMQISGKTEQMTLKMISGTRSIKTKSRLMIQMHKKQSVVVYQLHRMNFQTEGMPLKA